MFVLIVNGWCLDSLPYWRLILVIVWLEGAYCLLLFLERSCNMCIYFRVHSQIIRWLFELWLMLQIFTHHLFLQHGFAPVCRVSQIVLVMGARLLGLTRVSPTCVALYVCIACLDQPTILFDFLGPVLCLPNVCISQIFI